MSRFMEKGLANSGEAMMAQLLTSILAVAGCWKTTLGDAGQQPRGTVDLFSYDAGVDHWGTIVVQQR